MIAKFVIRDRRGSEFAREDLEAEGPTDITRRNSGIISEEAPSNFDHLLSLDKGCTSRSLFLDFSDIFRKYYRSMSLRKRKPSYYHPEQITAER